MGYHLQIHILRLFGKCEHYYSYWKIYLELKVKNQ